MNEKNVNSFILSTINALLGDFCQNLRAVQVDVKDITLITWFYFDGEITKENMEFASVATSESFASATKGDYVEEHFERFDYPLRIPNKGRFVYLRYEEPATQEITYQFLGYPLEKLFNALNKATNIPVSEVYWPPLIELLLQEAFLGSIKPNMRAVKGELDELEKMLYIWIYFEGEISTNDRYLMNIAIDKVKAYFKNYFTVESFIERLDRPQKIPFTGTLIFYSNDFKKSDDQDEVKYSE